MRTGEDEERDDDDDDDDEREMTLPDRAAPRRYSESNNSETCAYTPAKSRTQTDSLDQVLYVTGA